MDLSALKLTAYTIKSLGDSTLNPGFGEPVKIMPTDDTGSGQVQDKAKVALAELIARINDLFEGDLTPGDKLSTSTRSSRGSCWNRSVWPNRR